MKYPPDRLIRLTLYLKNCPVTEVVFIITGDSYLGFEDQYGLGGLGRRTPATLIEIDDRNGVTHMFKRADIWKATTKLLEEDEES